MEEEKTHGFCPFACPLEEDGALCLLTGLSWEELSSGEDLNLYLPSWETGVELPHTLHSVHTHPLTPAPPLLWGCSSCPRLPQPALGASL